MKKSLFFLSLLLVASGVKGAELKPSSAVQTLSAGSYELCAADGETAAYVLTTAGSADPPVKANLVIATGTDGTVDLTLQAFQIVDDAPVVVTGTGTVIFRALTGTTCNIFHDRTSTGTIIHAPEATVRFQSGEGSLILNIKNPSAESGSGINILPVKAKTVVIESGTLECRAYASYRYADGFPLTPVIDAERVVFTGAGAFLYPTVYAGNSAITTSYTDSATISPAAIGTQQRAVIKCTSLSFSDGVLIKNGTTFPENSFSTLKRYNYPDGAYTALLAQSNGGALAKNHFSERTFWFPDWTVFGKPEDYTGCFKSATGRSPDEITVDSTAKTITVEYTDTDEDPDEDPDSKKDPVVVYTEGSVPDAVSLFGVTPVPTAAGLQVTYAFGIEQIGFTEVEGAQAVTLQLGVELPAETDNTAAFFITVQDAAGTVLYQDTVPFTRVASGSARFRSGDLRTAHVLAKSASQTRSYRVTAREAATE